MESALYLLSLSALCDVANDALQPAVRQLAGHELPDEGRPVLAPEPPFTANDFLVFEAAKLLGQPWELFRGDH
ncbi:MAG TPA: hypothetical protein VF456_13025, partial [Vicinamibacterales bacterium]